MKTNRGGHTLKTGKIGRVNCLRQQLLMPNERMDIRIKGSVRLEALRERDVMRINAMLVSFIQPVRWCETNWDDYVKDGPDAGFSVDITGNYEDLSTLGVGSYDGVGAVLCLKMFETSVLKCHNEWFKHPEDPDSTNIDLQSATNRAGLKAVPLSKTWTRCRYTATPDQTDDYELSSATEFDIRDLAEKEARFRSAMKRDILSYNRWKELIADTWKGDGSREVDQVPMMLDKVEIGVNPREIPATNAEGLGQWMSLFDFQIDHEIPGIIAPEHSIVSHFLVIRFPSTIEGIHPLAQPNIRDEWHTMVGDPEWLSAAQPVEVFADEIIQTGNGATSFGYLPAGWQWRADHDVVGKQIDIRDSFPYMLQPTTKEQCKDATRVKDAFRDQSLDDYLVDVYFTERGYQPIGNSMDSYMSGMMDDQAVDVGGRGAEFPHGGKML